MDHEQCATCGFDGSEYEPEQLLDAIRGLGPQWIRLLSQAGDELRLRPSPETWSALEYAYAAHRRDVTALHVFRVEQALRVDEPRFPAIAGEELIQIASASYAAQDPGVVGRSSRSRLESWLIWLRNQGPPHGPEASQSAIRGAMCVSFSNMRSTTRTTIWWMWRMASQY